MKLTELINENCTLCAVQATSKKRILELLCEKAAESYTDFNTYSLLESLMAREKMGSTGIGNGIAIPHGRLTDGGKVVVVIATTESPIDFDAIDNRPVDIFIALFVPEENCQQHLSTLQSIAQIFSDKKTCKQVRKCHSSSELFNLLKNNN
ncbi:PTS IIA-like nitrogen regulatory protein PtsN [Colwellia sp. 1_MG-2023]|uniref:PTS IIA-like nitrogen regulatory protein PtsN n=1 Tax=Colwellia sp. 1_MG-2023 TaxID=3062649 RepID=UPI0026E2EBA0|nr:PTS IIA-like nitrogen regulatory protein PtsN [Colwellia sp. 1_MG-2023]MDO6444794.1 PTS IIA-like nitrogen regulatory protein PtsN [Colwellia sp. 1_MG-2023]